MGKINWAKAGVRLRRTPDQHGRNPDWNWAAERWKTAPEYAAETLTPAEVVDKADCPRCEMPKETRCVDFNVKPMDHPHSERERAAGEALIADGWKL